MVIYIYIKAPQGVLFFKEKYRGKKKDFGKILKINRVIPPEEEVLCVAIFE